VARHHGRSDAIVNVAYVGTGGAMLPWFDLRFVAAGHGVHTGQLPGSPAEGIKTLIAGCPPLLCSSTAVYLD